MAKASKAAEQPSIPSDQLAAITAKVRELVDAKHLIENTEARLSELNKQAYALEREQLPELMLNAGVDRLGIPAEGNYPAYDLKMDPYYKASISAEWEADKRRAAFEYLESKGAADLIRTEVIISLPREMREKAKELMERINADLDAMEATANIETKENVHWATLTSWLKETTEAGEDVDLEKIGGQAGSIVKPKPRKK